MKFCHHTRVHSKMGLFCLALGMTFGLGFGPFAVAQAQDIKAVEQRLIEAVSKGELSLRQAAAMVQVLERSSQASQWGKGGHGSQPGAWQRGPQMHHRPTGGPPAWGGRPGGGPPPQRDGVKREAPRPDSARVSEKKSDGDHGSRGDQAKHGDRGSRGDQSGRGDVRAQYPNAQARLMAAVKSGDMTPEEARQKMRELMGRSDNDNQEASVDRRRMVYQHAEAAMKKMVADKKITEEEAKDRLTSLKKRLMSEPEKPEAAAKAKSEKKADPKSEKKADPKAEKKEESKAEKKEESKAEKKEESKAEKKEESKAEPKAEKQDEPRRGERRSRE